MPVGAFVPSRIHLDYPEWQTPVVGDTGKVWAYTGSGYAPASFLAASAVSAFGLTLIDDADAATARTTLGLGTMAVAAEASYLLADGSRTGATSSRQAFTSGITTGSIRPAANGTAAFQVQTAAGTSVVTVDTTNQRVGIGTTPTSTLHISSSINPSSFRIQSTALGTGLDSFHFSGWSYANNTGTAYLGQNVYWDGAGNNTRDNTSNPAWALWLSTRTNSFAVVYTNSAGTLSYPLAILPSGVIGISGSTASSVDTGLARNAAGVVEINNGTAGQIADIQIRSINPTVGNVAIGQTSAAALLDLAASTTSRASLRVRAGTTPTSPNAGDIWYPTGGRLNVYRAATETIASGVPGTGGAATATGTWGATEQAMLQAVYDIARSFGMLS